MAAAVLLTIVLGLADEFRVWTDATGKFKVDAAFIKIDGDSVVLKRKMDNTEFRVPIAKLSKADQVLLDSKRTTGPASDPIGLYEKQANTMRTASDAVLLYANLLADRALSDKKAQLEERKKHWESLAKSKFLRMGDKWLSLEDAKNLEESEQQLLQEAQRLLELSDLQFAGERLRKASQANPQSIKADFWIGLVLSLVLGDPDEAQKYFTTCVQRRQKYQSFLCDAERRNLVASLNNFAIVRVRQAEYRPALTAWQQAIELGAPTKELVQNLGKMAALASSHPHLKVPTGIAREASELYSRVATATEAGKFQEDVGWLFMRMVDEPTASQVVGVTPTVSATVEKPKTISPPSSGDLLLVGGGTGFVIAPGYVVTNHHVVDNAAAVKIKTPGETDKEIDAVVISETALPDLALLKCTMVDIPPVLIRPTVPRLGADLGVVGFPRFDVLGTGIKATRGVMTGLSDSELDNMLLYDALTNPGNSGGPVFDKYGRVCAVHTAGFAGWGKYAMAVPASQLIAFLSTRPEVKFKTNSSDAAEVPWEDAVDLVAKSTVQVLIYQAASTMKFARRESKDGISQKWDAFEDGWCMTCHGTSLVRCAAGCANGKLRSQGVVTLGTTANGTAITKRTTIYENCSKCGGSGKVSCSNCYHGIERALSR